MKFLLILLIILAASSLTDMKEPDTFIRLPVDNNTRILRVGDKDFKVAWWPWGPYSIEERAAAYRMSPDHLRRMIREAK